MRNFLNVQVFHFLATGALFYFIILLSIPSGVGCGIIVMCPSNDAYRRKLDADFYDKTKKCENGEDASCTNLSEEANQKIQMCKDCRGCSGNEKYNVFAMDALDKNHCLYHHDGDACFSLATREGTKAELLHVYSFEEVEFYEKSCEYGNSLGCKMAKSRRKDAEEGVARNIAKKECESGCKLLYEPCMKDCNESRRNCDNKCASQVRTCLRSCNSR